MTKTVRYAIKITQGDPVLVGAYVRKHTPDPSGLRQGVCFTSDRRLARVFRDRDVAERLVEKLAARGSGSGYEIVDAP